MSTKYCTEENAFEKIMQIESMVFEKLQQLETIVSDNSIKQVVEDLKMTCRGRKLGLSSLVKEDGSRLNQEQSEELGTTLISELDRLIVEAVLKSITTVKSLYLNELSKEVSPLSKKYFEIFKEETDTQCRNIVNLAKEKGFYKVEYEQIAGTAEDAI